MPDVPWTTAAARRCCAACPSRTSIRPVLIGMISGTKYEVSATTQNTDIGPVAGVTITLYRKMLASDVAS